MTQSIAERFFPQSGKALPVADRSAKLRLGKPFLLGKGLASGAFATLAETGETHFYDLEGRRLKTIEVPIDEVTEAMIQHPEYLVVASGFNLAQAIEDAKKIGPAIEVAGPTKPKSYRLGRQLRATRHIAGLLTSNIEPKMYNRWSDTFYDAQLDYKASALHLPHPDESIGAVFTSNFDPTPAETREKLPFNMVKEFYRVLKPGGIAVFNAGLNFNNLEQALNLGLEPWALHCVQAIRQPDQSHTEILDAVLHKPVTDTGE